MDVTGAEIEKRVVQYYLHSRDFNGITLSQLSAELGVELDQLRERAVEQVKAGRISIVSPHQSNPFIKMFDVPTEEQLDGLDGREPQFVCLYPTPPAVRAEVDVSAYDDRPFTKVIVLAAPQLAALPFRLDVLDAYERDPRYWFRFYDFGGTISVHDQYYEQMDQADKIDLRFGVGHDDKGNRVVAVYMRDLARLPGRQQRIWKEFLVDRECHMSEEYFKTTILAEFPDTVSVYEAIIYEQAEVNKLFELMGRPRLFRETYEDQRRPRGFSFFVKPTQGQYNDFVHLLDKMLSENINLASFGKDVRRYHRVEVSKGEFERQQRGSIAMLEEWLRLRFPDTSPEDLAAIIAPLREVRKLRQEPAHSIPADKYDNGLYDLQDALVWKVYRCINKLRHTLMADEVACSYQPPHWDGLTVKSY